MPKLDGKKFEYTKSGKAKYKQAKKKKEIKSKKSSKRNS